MTLALLESPGPIRENSTAVYFLVVSQLVSKKRKCLHAGEWGPLDAMPLQSGPGIAGDRDSYATGA